jgi:transmembrane sensor
MENFEKYTLEDFVQDLYFRRWAMGKLAPSDTNWQKWLAQNPQKRAMVEEARSLVLATIVEEPIVQATDYQHDIGLILKKTSIQYASKNLLNFAKIAAALCITFGLIYYWQKQNLAPYLVQKVQKTSTTKTENKGDTPLEMTLADGTKVKLKTGGSLLVANNFNKENRTVYLQGEAVFDVKKDPQHPFLVYAGGIVTKVLGTSFSVRAYATESKTMVAVRHGRVAVYKDDKARKSEFIPEQILLMPNQQVVFDKKEEKLVKTLVSEPFVLEPLLAHNLLVFDETPIPIVLQNIELAYGLKILYDADLLQNCNLTASFDQETLYQKIEIICETIKAKYEIADGQIVIYAKGCK